MRSIILCGLVACGDNAYPTFDRMTDWTLVAPEHSVGAVVGEAIEVPIRISGPVPHPALELRLESLPEGVAADRVVAQPYDVVVEVRLTTADAAAHGEPVTAAVVASQGEQGEHELRTELRVFVRGRAGALDTTFASTGLRRVDFGWQGYSLPESPVVVAVRPDGELIVAATIAATLGLAVNATRLASDGGIAPGFGEPRSDPRIPSGTVFTSIVPPVAVLGVIARPDGSFVIGATRATGDGIVAISYTAAGQLDDSFGDHGFARFRIDVPGLRTGGAALRQDSRGRLVFAGYASSSFDDSDAWVVRFDPNGTLDATFGTAGYARFGMGGRRTTAHDLAIRDDDSVVVVGVAKDAGVAPRVAVASLTETGRLDGRGDLAFGVTVNDEIDPRIALDREGRPVVAAFTRVGCAMCYRLARLHGDNTPDPTFGVDGWSELGPSGVPRSVVVDDQGRIVVGGSKGGLVLARYATDGVLDRTFGVAGAVATELGGEDGEWVYSLGLVPDGRIAASGIGGVPTRAVVARYWH